MIAGTDATPPAGTVADAATALSSDNPWPGLLAFRESDRQYFQGRRGETDELLRLVRRERLTVLFGLSGLGKSSLLQAGLFPPLRAEQVFPVYIRLDFSRAEPDFAEQVWAAVVSQALASRIEVPKSDPGDTLWERLHRSDADFWNERNRPVVPLLVFDQFEEIFTLGRRDDARRAATERLIESLSDLAEGRPPASVKAHLDAHPEQVSQFVFGDHRYKLLLGIREDFLPELETLRDRLTAIPLNRLRLKGMDGVAALEVVNQAPHLIDADVAEQVVRFVAAGREGQPLTDVRVEPALLSVVCRELNAARQHRKEAKITPDLLKGSQDEVLATFYDTSVADLPPEARAFIEDRLLTVSGYRDSVALENALSTPGMSRAVIDRLVERRLIRIEDRSGTQRIELTHDLLTGVVGSSRKRRREVEEAERERIARIEAQEREQVALGQLRRSRRLALLFLAISIAAVGAALWALIAQREAARRRVQAGAAEARAFIDDAVRSVEAERPDQALAYLARALRADPDSLAARSWATDLLGRQWWVPSTPIEHPAAVTSAEFSPDGSRLLTATADGYLHLWDPVTRQRIGTPIREKSGIPSRIVNAVFTADGSRVVVVWQDNTLPELERHACRIGLVDATTGSLVRPPMVSQLLGQHTAVTQDGRRALVKMASDVQVIDVATGERAAGPFPVTTVYGSKFSPDGRRLALNEAVGTWSLWNVEDGTKIGDMTAAGNSPLFVRGFTADGARLVAQANNRLQLWNAATATLEAEVGSSGQSLAFDSHGSRFLSIDDQRVSLQDAADLQRRFAPLLHAAVVRTARFSPDGTLAITVVDDASVRIWDLAGLSPIGQPLHHARTIRTAAMSNDGRRIVTGSDDGTARIWELSRGKLAPGLNIRKWERAASLSADGRRAATLDGDNTVRLWRTDTWSAVDRPFKPADEAADVALSPDGKWLVSFHREAEGYLTARVWNAEAGTATNITVTGLHSEFPILFSGDSRRIAFRRARNDTFEVRTLPDGAIRTPVKGAHSFGRPALSPDGRLLFVGEPVNSSVLWDVDGGKGTLTEPTGSGTDVVAFSGDGSLVAVARKETVQVWNLRNNTTVGQLERNDHDVDRLLFTPDGRRLVATAGTFTQIWDVATGRRATSAIVNSAKLDTLALSSDSRRMLTSVLNEASIWEVGSATPVATAFNAGGKILESAFTPDGDRVILLVNNKSIVNWRVLFGPGEDDDEEVERLADLAEEVSGYRFNEFGSLVPPFGDDGTHRAELRRWAADHARPNGTDVASFIKAFFAGN